MAQPGNIRVGIGGWTFEPWRGTFFPEKLAHKRELEFASRQLTAIEVNGTYYGSQSPASFARWHDETPDGFVFAVKGPRFTTNRRVLAEAGSSIERFFASGVTRLAGKLGPINWQFLPTKRFDAEDFAAFLALLPKAVDGVAIRHAVEVRHESFAVPDFVALCREHGVAAIITDKADFPQINDVTAPFVYARLQRCREAVATGYPADEIAAWTERARTWAQGGAPGDLPLLAGPDAKPQKRPPAREVFVFMINGFKPKAPFAAMAMIEQLKSAG